MICQGRIAHYPSQHGPHQLARRSLAFCRSPGCSLAYSQSAHTPHGFRASASSLLHESGKWHADAIEAELGHLGADEVRKAYHRARYWDERVKMAEWWASETQVTLLEQ